MITAPIATKPHFPAPVSRVSRKVLSRPHINAGLRIAVADGDDRVLEAHQGLLSILGHKAVSLSQTGHDLLAACLALKPDLVVIEATLPDADGLDVATELLHHRQIPIVLVTPGRDSGLMEQAMRRGVLATVSKPFRLSDLCAAIAHAQKCFDQLHAIRRQGTRLVTTLGEGRMA